MTILLGVYKLTIYYIHVNTILSNDTYNKYLKIKIKKILIDLYS